MTLTLARPDHLSTTHRPTDSDVPARLAVDVLRGVLDSMQTRIFVADHHLDLVYANPLALETLRRLEPELVAAFGVRVDELLNARNAGASTPTVRPREPNMPSAAGLASTTSPPADSSTMPSAACSNSNRYLASRAAISANSCSISDTSRTIANETRPTGVGMVAILIWAGNSVPSRRTPRTVERRPIGRGADAPLTNSWTRRTCPLRYRAGISTEMWRPSSSSGP